MLWIVVAVLVIPGFAILGTVVSLAWAAVLGKDIQNYDNGGWLIICMLLSVFTISFVSELSGKIRDTTRFKRLIAKNTGHPISFRIERGWDLNQAGDYSQAFEKGIIRFSDGIEFECRSEWALRGIQKFCKKTYPSFFQEVRAGE